MEEPEQVTVSHQYSYGGESKEAPLVRGTATGRGPTEEVARLAATEDLYRQLTAQHDEAAARFARDGLFNDADALTRAVAALAYTCSTVLCVPSVWYAPVMDRVQAALNWRPAVVATMGPEAAHVVGQVCLPLLEQLVAMDRAFHSSSGGGGEEEEEDRPAAAAAAAGPCSPMDA